jgi:hypothetical protein
MSAPRPLLSAFSLPDPFPCISNYFSVLYFPFLHTAGASSGYRKKMSSSPNVTLLRSFNTAIFEPGEANEEKKKRKERKEGVSDTYRLVCTDGTRSWSRTTSCRALAVNHKGRHRKRAMVVCWMSRLELQFAYLTFALRLPLHTSHYR